MTPEKIQELLRNMIVGSLVLLIVIAIFWALTHQRSFERKAPAPAPTATRPAEQRESTVFVNPANGRMSVGGGNVLIGTDGKVEVGIQSDNVFVDTDGKVHVGF